MFSFEDLISLTLLCSIRHMQDYLKCIRSPKLDSDSIDDWRTVRRVQYSRCVVVKLALMNHIPTKSYTHAYTHACMHTSTYMHRG